MQVLAAAAMVLGAGVMIVVLDFTQDAVGRRRSARRACAARLPALRARALDLAVNGGQDAVHPSTVPGLPRRFILLDQFRDSYGDAHETRHYARESEANLVSSELSCGDWPGWEGWHTPALDIDAPVYVLPSSTPGHHHLFIDIPMPWRTYKKLLRALRDAGVIEPGYYNASVRRQATHLRKPGVVKTQKTTRQIAVQH
jgi:hypothetical protein